MLESGFQGHLIKRLNDIVGRDGFVLKTDPNYIQGFPDILVLYRDRWAALECKKSLREPFQPNQEYYLDCIMNRMTFAGVVYPENEDEVINDLQQALRIGRR